MECKDRDVRRWMSSAISTKELLGARASLPQGEFLPEVAVTEKKMYHNFHQCMEIWCALLAAKI